MTTPPEYEHIPVQVARPRPRRSGPRQPYMTYALIALSVLVFLVQVGSQFLLGFDLPVALGAKVNARIAAGEVWRLFSPILLHGGILHIAFNMYALNVLGGPLERWYGHGRFLALYLVAGFGGNVVSMLFTPAPSVGASTSLFGVIGAYGVFLYHNRQVLGENNSRRALGEIVRLAAINLLIGLSPGIDNWGHAGGLLAGVLFAWLGGPRLQLQSLMWEIQITDTRGPEAWLRAAALTLLLFALLAAAGLYLMETGSVAAAL